jgi:hypothetical protein
MKAAVYRKSGAPDVAVGEDLHGPLAGAPQGCPLQLYRAFSRLRWRKPQNREPQKRRSAPWLFLRERHALRGLPGRRFLLARFLLQRALACLP